MLRSRVPHLLFALTLFASGSSGRTQTPLHPGLVASASDGQRTVKFALPTPNFTLLPNESLHPTLKPNFKVEWNGMLKLARSGRYTLHADAKVFVDGKEIQGRPTQLEAGERPLKVEFARRAGAMARVQLQW